MKSVAYRVSFVSLLALSACSSEILSPAQEAEIALDSRVSHYSPLLSHALGQDGRVSSLGRSPSASVYGGLFDVNVVSVAKSQAEGQSLLMLSGAEYVVQGVDSAGNRHRLQLSTTASTSVVVFSTNDAPELTIKMDLASNTAQYHFASHPENDFAFDRPTGTTFTLSSHGQSRQVDLASTDLSGVQELMKLNSPHVLPLHEYGALALAIPGSADWLAASERAVQGIFQPTVGTVRGGHTPYKMTNTSAFFCGIGTIGADIVFTPVGSFVYGLACGGAACIDGC